MKGTFCGLTKEKHDFKDKCSKINFGEKREEIIKETNIDYELISRQKLKSYTSFYLYLIIALLVMLAGIWLGKISYDNGAFGIWTVLPPLFLTGIGAFLVLPLAFGPLNYYRKNFIIENTKKQEMDTILGTYNIKYLIDIDVVADRHGNQTIKTDLIYTRKYKS